MADVATVFNQNIVPYAPGPRTGAEPPVKRIVVVGGGTAGWMTALLLANSDYGPRLQVTVLESPQVGTIGVGEGSTPWLRGFFDGLGIEESEWMPACNATYKNGIRFDGWCTKPGYESYFHPFASMLDNMTMTQFIDNVHRRMEHEDVETHPDRFFIASRLAQRNQGPRPRHDFPFDVWYAYHFDSSLLGAFLQRKAVERGVHHMPRHVQEVTLNEQGDIAALRLDGDETLAGDFFVDCTGFASLLIGKALKTPYVSFAENLFNDAAVALPSPVEGHGERPLMAQTVSTALRHGWAWKIPLTHRNGNGYVYSTAHCSPDEAEAELRAHLGMLDDDTPARHLRMRVGRVAQHWNRNCVAIGLSQGFIEPLEATTLLFVQRTATMLVKALEKGDLGESTRNSFNEAINDRFEGTRDYIVTHYKTNTRTDTEYWRANAANVNLSQPLQRLLRTWLSSRPIIGGLQQGTYGRGYPAMSWYCMLAGMGLFPDPQDMHATPPGKLQHNLTAIDNLLERSAANFPDHRSLLANIPPRPRETSLQLYLW
jgi:2-polyprenyl-6-methoxyphenol hydroxylase-like FAD-dependent oxidoreductase